MYVNDSFTFDENSKYTQNPIYLFTSVQAWWKIDILVYINEARGVDNMLKNTRWHRVGFMLVGENLEFNFVIAHFGLITLLRAAYI